MSLLTVISQDRRQFNPVAERIVAEEAWSIGYRFSLDNPYASLRQFASVRF